MPFVYRTLSNMTDQRIGVRIEEDLKNQIKEIAELRGESLSIFVRRALLKELASLSVLDDDRKKALKIKEA